MPGRYFDEWTVGDRVAHPITRTVTEADNLLISTLTHNPQPLHLDAEAAGQSEFGRILVNSCFTFSLLVGVSVADTTLGVLVANLGFDEAFSYRVQNNQLCSIDTIRVFDRGGAGLPGASCGLGKFQPVTGITR